MLTQISYKQAAAILGCHVSNVAKLAAKGELTSSGKRGGSLDRERVRRSPYAVPSSEQHGLPDHLANTN
jgi:hypothetical protein